MSSPIPKFPPYTRDFSEGSLNTPIQHKTPVPINDSLSLSDIERSGLTDEQSTHYLGASSDHLNESWNQSSSSLSSDVTFSRTSSKAMLNMMQMSYHHNNDPNAMDMSFNQMSRYNREVCQKLKPNATFQEHSDYLDQFHGTFTPRFQKNSKAYLAAITNILTSMMVIYMIYQKSFIYILYLVNVVANYIFFMAICFGTLTLIKYSVIILFISMIFNLVISLLHLFHVIDSIMMDISIGYGVLELFVAVLACWALGQCLLVFYYPEDSDDYTYFYFLQCRRRKENSIKKKRAELGAILSMYFYRLLHAL